MTVTPAKASLLVDEISAVPAEKLLFWSKNRAPCPETRRAIGFFVADGRSPGSRVIALGAAFPGIPSGFRPWLFAYSCGDSRGFEIEIPHRIPS